MDLQVHKSTAGGFEFSMNNEQLSNQREYTLTFQLSSKN